MAVKTKTQLSSDINMVLADNTSGAITPAVLRSLLGDMVDSLKTQLDYVDVSSAVITSNYTVQLSDHGKTLRFSGNITVTMPAALADGVAIHGINVGTGTIGLAASGGTLDSDGTNVTGQMHSFNMISMPGLFVFADGDLS